MISIRITLDCSLCRSFTFNFWPVAETISTDADFWGPVSNSGIVAWIEFRGHCDIVFNLPWNTAVHSFCQQLSLWKSEKKRLAIRNCYPIWNSPHWKMWLLVLGNGCVNRSHKSFFPHSLKALFCLVPLPRAEEEIRQGGARSPPLKPVQVNSCRAGMRWKRGGRGGVGIVGRLTTQKGVVRLISARVGSR